MFVKKTSAQIKAMSDAEFDTYTAEKEAFDASQIENKMKSAVEEQMKTLLPKAVTDATKELQTSVETLTEANKTLANAFEAAKEEGKKGKGEDPFAAVKQSDIDDFNANSASNKRVSFTVKSAGTMLVSTNVSGNTNFNMTMEPGIARAPIPVPLMVRIADVRTVKNKGMNGIPTIGWVNKKNMDGNAAITAEGALKPLRDFDIVGETQSPYEIAVRTNVGKYMLRDVGELKETINIDLREEMDREAGEQYLSGTGVSEMKGITEYASAYTDTSLNGTVEDANDLDAIIAACLQLELLNWRGVITAVVNPVTYAKIYTYKGLKHRDLVVVAERGGQLYVNNILIMKDVEIASGYILIGDMSKSHIRIIDDVEIEVGYGASTDDFNKNLVTVRADMRALHFVKDVETSAIIYDSLATIKAAIAAA